MSFNIYLPFLKASLTVSTFPSVVRGTENDAVLLYYLYHFYIIGSYRCHMTLMFCHRLYWQKLQKLFHNILLLKIFRERTLYLQKEENTENSDQPVLHSNHFFSNLFTLEPTDLSKLWINPFVTKVIVTVIIYLLPCSVIKKLFIPF